MPTVDDAWAAEANAPDRLLRGNLLKYVDRVWSCGRDDKPMRKGVQLFAAGVATAWQRWAGRKPVEA